MQTKHLRTVHKDRVTTCKVKTEPRRVIEELQSAIRSRRPQPNGTTPSLGRSIELSTQKRILSEDMRNTKSIGKESIGSPQTAFAARQRISSFLPSLDNYEVKYSTNVQKRNHEIARDYSEESQKSWTKPERRTSKAKRKKSGPIVVEPAQSHPQTVGGTTQRTEVSINDFFEYSVKYSCRTAAGRTSNNKEKINQDCFVVVPCLNGRTYKHFFAVCDGHGIAGQVVSRIIKQEFARRLARFRHSTVDFDANYQKLINYYFGKVEEALLRDKSLERDIEFSGSTCTSVWMNNSKMYCASVGDSRAIIVYEQEANGSSEENMNSFVQGDNRIFTIVQLSTDHKIERSDEAERIQACGGEIGRINGKGPLRIWKPGNNFPGLSMTRSFGDKVAHTLGVIATPEIYCYQMTRRERILVLGSDGLWEFMSNLQVVQLVSQFYDSNDIDGACRALMQAARLRWQQHCKIIDDITFMVFFFGFH